MRVEPYGVGSFIHVVNRGARGLEIVRDKADSWRFLRMLFLLNDEHFQKNWIYQSKNKSVFHRSESWPERKPIVEIHAYTLMPNHFHLLLRESTESGVSRFMQKLGQSMTNYTNEKYRESGSIFQGSYRSKTIDTDEYLRYVAAYIMTKNTFELYPKGGLQSAVKKFDTAWDWAAKYEFSSLGDYSGYRNKTPILVEKKLDGIFTPKTFKTFSREVIEGGKWEERLDLE